MAEVFIGLLQGDKLSYLVQEPDWQPTLPTAVGSARRQPAPDFTIVDLLSFAGVGLVR